MEKPGQALSVTAAFLFSLDAKGGLCDGRKRCRGSFRDRATRTGSGGERGGGIVPIYISQQEIMSAPGQENSQERR